jgi:uncharacterized protein YaiI (UPF0178 family)
MVNILFRGDKVMENKGQWYTPSETEEQRKKRVEKAMEHERTFGQRQESDIIKKRMDSDLFKGGLR